MQQTLIDIATEKYGTPEAVAILIDDNPALFTNDREFELTADVETHGSASLHIREETDVMDKKVLKELDGKVIIS